MGIYKEATQGTLTTSPNSGGKKQEQWYMMEKKSDLSKFTLYREAWVYRTLLQDKKTEKYKLTTEKQLMQSTPISMNMLC